MDDQPVSLSAYRQERRAASVAAHPSRLTDSATALAWERILGQIPREERLRYAGLLGEEITSGAALGVRSPRRVGRVSLAT